VALPEDYIQYVKKENKKYIVCKEDDLEIDLFFYSNINQIQENKGKKQVLYLQHLNHVSENAENLKRVDYFIVEDIVCYEVLSYEFSISKENIFIVPRDNLKQIGQIIKYIVEKNEYLRYYFSSSLNRTSGWDVGNNQDVCVETKDYDLINSQLDAKDSCYIYYNKMLPIKENACYKVTTMGKAKGNIQAKLFFVLQQGNKKVATYSVGLEETLYIETPKEVDACKIMIRIQGSGEIQLVDIIVEDVDDINDILGNQENLVLTNAYPSSNDLYKNGFVHRRVLGYQKENVNMDVFILRNQEGLIEYSFEGVKVLVGNKTMLLRLLKRMRYTKILIHFINRDMVEAIEEANINTHLFVWIHGAGAERYERRIFNYSPEELATNKNELRKKDDEQMAFMKRVYTAANVTTVYVSEYIKQVAEEDSACITRDPVVIPNIIDSELFSYKEKPIHHRKKILFIRPFVANNYACDLAIKVILELSKKEFFDELTFNIYGTGPLFDEIVEPITEFRNVSLNKTFLRQDRIAELHKKHGIMLIPTRHDTQGVSMGEAMSSGLVVVTNGVCAIPEYVDNSCGVIVKDEDYIEMAKQIERLYYEPERFIELSKQAAIRVRNQCGIENTIKKELELVSHT
jgi:glycosyltransferase involved in cell wall biosynthesis